MSDDSTDFTITPEGWELTLKWSRDETMVTLTVFRPDGQRRAMRLPTVQLLHLSDFILSHIEPEGNADER